jgi:hypothetical protein
MVDTQADNAPARRFFEKNGFGSVEKHVYFSLELTPNHIPDELLQEAQQQHKGEAAAAAEPLSRGNSLTGAGAAAVRLFCSDLHHVMKRPV